MNIITFNLFSLQAVLGTYIYLRRTYNHTIYTHIGMMLSF